MLRALGFQGGRQESFAEGDVGEITDDQPRNSFTELQLLDRHKDIVRWLGKIDNSRFVSAGDDGSVIIWETETGRPLRKVGGHKRPVTCILLLPNLSSLMSSSSHDSASIASMDNNSIHISPPAGLLPDWLITASSDKSIQMWNIDQNKQHRTLQAPGSVKCLVPLYQGTMFCSAGSSITIWSSDGEMMCNCPRPKADSDIHTVVPIRGNRLVVASDRSALSVFNVEQPATQPNKPSITFFRMLQPHKESIRCLVTVSDAMIASSSLDGMVVLWSTLSLSPMRKFNEYEKYRDNNHTFPYCVHHLVALEGRYLLAAIGSGFCMFDVIAAMCVVKRNRAHVSTVNHMAFVAGGSMLCTCSEDGIIRLWSISSSEPSEEVFKSLGASSPVETFMGEKELISHRKAAKPISPTLIGQLAGHSGAVQRLLDLSPDGFASCSSDQLIILWKHGVKESQKRDEAVRSFLHSGCGNEEHLPPGELSPPKLDFDSSIF